MGDEANPAMKPASSEQAVFAGALQRDQPEARAAYLDAACGTDSALRQRIEALLHAAESAGDFLEAPPTGLREDADSTLHMGEFSEKPGDKIGRYKLLQQIGEGGCGVVYMAEQLEPVRRRVALKVIKLGMDTRSVIARFEAERQALALMDHPNIAKVLDGGATQTGRLYFVMELVRGVRITEFCDEARLSTKARLQLFVQVCHAIQHAHQKGIIHRDLKPSNILVTVNDGAPVPKVIDFGIAKATGQRLTDKTLFTQFHAFIGTPAYISPEQAEMSSVDVDTRSDIYSLGVLLYELLTGCTPFDGEELLRSGLDEMRRVIRDDQPPRPSTRLATLGVAEVTELSGKRRTTVSELAGATRGDLDCIVMKCLEKDRSRRYETANGLTTDIQRYLHNEPVSARPPSAIYWLRKLARRNRGALIAATMVLVALLVALVTLATSNARIRHERNQKDQALKERGAALDAAREQLFVSLQSQAQARRHSGQMGQRFESLAALAEAARIRPDAQLRDSAIAAMAIPDVNLGPPWPNPEGVIGAFDAAFQRVARFSTNGTISIRSIPDNRELQRLEFNPDTSSDLVAFSPDGRFFANLRDRSTLLLWSCESGKSVFKSPPENCSTLAFSPDGRQLAVAQGTSIACFDLGTGDPIRQWPARGRPYVMKYDPAGRRLAIGYLGSNVVSIYEAETGVEQATLPIGADTGSSVGWHPEGDLLATGGSDGRIQLWDVTTQQRLAVLEGHVEYVTTLSFHPEGELLASGSWDGVVRLWQPSPGRLLMRLPMAGTMLFGSASRWAGVMMPDNEQLHHFEVITGGEYRTFLNHFPSGAGELREGEISPDGTLLVLAGAEGVRLWDIACGREVALLRMEDNIQACFISGGREMLSCGPIDGLQRWSIEPNPGPEGGLRIARPHRIPLPFGPLRMAKSSHEHFLAIVGESAGQSLLLDLRTESPLGPSMSHSKVGYVALTSQAERMVTSGWRSPCVKLWDATNSKLIKEFVDEAGIVFFTPDDRELIVANGKEIIFQNLNTFEINRRIPLAPGLYPGHVAFTADAKLMAMELAPGVIHLKETVSGRTVARLEDPYGDRSTWMSFTPDGTQLVVVARYASAIHRWDLRAIRARLKTMNLDWDWPEFPIQSGATAVSPTRKPLRVQVVEAAPPEFRQKSATNTPAGKP